MADAPALSDAVPVVVNTRAYSVRRRGDRAVADDLRAALESAGLRPRLAKVRPKRLVASLREAAASRPRMVVVGGGDGTVRTAAEILRETDTALGVIPLGFRNHFARDLGLALDVPSAVATLVEGEPRHVDVGEIDGFTFVNNFALGIYPDLVRSRVLHERFRPGRAFALFRATWDTLRRFPLVTVRVRSPRDDDLLRTPLVFVGNNRYEMGSAFGRRSRMDAGVLFLCAMRPTSRLGFLRTVARSLLVSVPREQDLLCRVHEEVDVDLGGRSAWATLDGEVQRVRGRLVCRVRPAALRVIAPRPPEGAAA